MIGKSEREAYGKSERSERFGKAVDSVLLDRKLTACARCVYFYLARWVFEGNVARTGQRKIAKDLGFHIETVNVAIQQLIAREHIQLAPPEVSRRHVYVLLSSAFASRDGKADVVRSGPSGVPRYVSLNHEREFGVA